MRSSMSSRMIARGGRAQHVDAQLFTALFGFVIEVPEHLHVVQHEPDGHDHDVVGPDDG